MKKISRLKALELMKNSKGQFFTAIFDKKDGTERIMNCQWLKDQKENPLGYVVVRDAALIKTNKNNCTRNINLQTLKSLRLSGQTYKIR